MIAQSFTDLHKTIAFLVAQHIQQMKSARDFRQVFAFYDSRRSFIIPDASGFSAGPDRQIGVRVSWLLDDNVKVCAAA